MPDLSSNWCLSAAVVNRKLTQRSGAIGLPDGERVDGPVEGLRVDQVPQQRGGGAGEAAAGQQGPRRVLPPGEREDSAFDPPHTID